MKSILSLSRHHYLRTVSIFLIAVILIAGVVGCEGEPVQYDLEIDSTVGGNVTAPGEGTHTYDDGEVVDLVAVPDCGYAFDNWTGDTGNIDDVNASTTNITMEADYSITANFKVKPLDHFKGYYVDWETAPYIDQYVSVTDQFVEDLVVLVEEARYFLNPTTKVYLDETTPISDDNHHLAVYDIYYEGYEENPAVFRSVEVTNQFGTQNVSVYGPFGLAVPTTKVEPGGHEKPGCLNHFLLYDVVEAEPIEVDVDLTDQFGTDQGVVVAEPFIFANPVQKTVGSEVTEIEVDEQHLLFYHIDDSATLPPAQVQVDNQFLAGQIFDLIDPAVLLGVPSQKIVPPTPPLDHFKCYPVAEGSSPEDVSVQLQDQFGWYGSVEVTWPMYFCNPVKKNLEPIVNPDNHLTVYIIEEISQWWDVTVDNQFGDDQELTVRGPIALAVPTQKLVPGDHEPPEYLNHYLLYEVWEFSNVTATVDLDDQFPGTAPGVEVIKPVFFATPAVKGHLGYWTFPWDPEGHLVFYLISYNEEFYYDDVVINNQFQQAPFSLLDDSELLAVPSVKVSYEPVL